MTPSSSPPFTARRRFQSVWQVARMSTADATPSAGDWIPASVPGAVQLDWARAHGLPDHNFGQNIHSLDGLEDSFWLYRTTVPRGPRAGNERLFLACDGVDYSCEVRLAGRFLSAHTGLLTPFEVDVSDAAPGSPLDVLFHPAPKRPGAPADRSQASDVTKPAVSYGWDWHPRLIPIGLCDEIGFEVRPASHLRHVDFAYTLAEDLSTAWITLTVEAGGPAAGVRWSLRDSSGALVLAASAPQAEFRRPQLWWTHDHGVPALYTLQVELDGGDTYVRRVGFRRVRLVMHEGGWGEPSAFPKTRSLPPVTVELNGRRIFAKGSNWVCPDIFPGRVDGGTYRPLLQLARDANFNLLRCWGGAPAAKEAFFDQCDALGLLVWQEFPLACNNYPDDPAYLALLDGESRMLVRRLRQHPCLGIWCGGNELFNPWSGMTDQSLPIRLLNRNCYELDPSTPFLPTAPVEGMGHGDYRFRDDGGRDIFEIFQSAANTAYSEFGCPGVSPAGYLRTFIPEAELWPPRAGTSWETHHALGSWEGNPSAWLFLPVIEHYFGPPATLEQMTAWGSLLQGEGYKSVFEEARRQQPRCSMALNWCFNEPWPTAANNSIVNWPASPKPAYLEVKAACRPALASARIPHFQWEAGREFTAELWLLNDTPGTVNGSKVDTFLVTDGKEQAGPSWTFSDVPPRTNSRGPVVRILLPRPADALFRFVLRVPDQPQLESSYACVIRTDASAGVRASARPAP